MTTFYAEESTNRRNSMLLAGTVIAVLAGFGFLVGYVIGAGSGSEVAFGVGATCIAVAFGLASVAGSLYGGDQLILTSSHAHLLEPAQNPALFNVVSELALAAGVPVPKIYVIDDPSPNAFATGRDPNHASVAVTSGLLAKMDREELQGVLGHEMSHVRNYDIRFTLLVGALVGSIALLAQILLRMTLWGGVGRSRGKNGGAILLVLLLVGLVMAVLAPIFSTLVQMAVSRQREYLADASSVELTRNPVGLERALAALASDPAPLKTANGATAHLYIVNPLKKFGGGSALFSTHPPIVDRINRLRALSGQAPLDDATSRSLGRES
jgi:heat shock protein HtpX